MHNFIHIHDPNDLDDDVLDALGSQRMHNESGTVAGDTELGYNLSTEERERLYRWRDDIAQEM